ncbi:MAG: DUF1566 domain-containing protein [Desulfobacteraceae bacterium]|nr:DUF1566 domain-containing protein [Desulfobacteraceae bacterium]
MTGLVWEKGGSPDYMSSKYVQSYIQELNREKFAGFDDWRLPTLEELASLLESEKVDGLFIDPLFDRNQECWTADKTTSDGAWLVGFNSGYVYRGLFGQLLLRSCCTLPDNVGHLIIWLI